MLEVDDRLHRDAGGRGELPHRQPGMQPPFAQRVPVHSQHRRELNRYRTGTQYRLRVPVPFRLRAHYRPVMIDT